MPDAVVIGAGPNGLVAANLLADAGWEVVVLEEQPEPGGAVRSAELIRPGYVHDLFSAFYPLAAASPIIGGFGLEKFGLNWSRAPLALAHPTESGDCAVLSTDVDVTAESLEASAPGDGEAWRRLYGLWEDVGDDLVDALFTPFPPIAPALRIAKSLGPQGFIRFARFATLPVRRLATEEFSGPAAALLLAGNALHSDVAPESVMSGFYGWLLASLGQHYGFPVPAGGAARLTAALQDRLVSHGGRIECNARVTKVEVVDGRAVGVRVADGTSVDASRAVLADIGAPALYLDLVGAAHLPARLLDGMKRFQYDNATVKVDWAVDGTIPWKSEPAQRAGTVHVADSLDELTMTSAQLQTGWIPAKPFLVLGQMTTSDPTRSPPGTETAWAYTHVPRSIRGDAGGELSGTWGEREAAVFADRIEERIEALAPGFRDRIIGRHVLTPRDMQGMDANLVDGAINGGTAQLHQMVIFRPTPGLGRAETPIKNLYLASASAHPGGGVHGAPGANAARAALGRYRRKRVVLPVGAGVVTAAVVARRRKRRR